MVKIAKNIEKNYEKVGETLRNLPKTLQDIPADGLERFWDIIGVKNIFCLHFSFKITEFESFWVILTQNDSNSVILKEKCK